MDNPQEPHPPLAGHVLADRTGFVLIKLGAMVEQGVEQLFAEFALTGRHFDLMASVDADESLSQRDLARLLGLAPNAVGYLVEDLERRGVMVRARSAADRRRHTLTLTADGAALLRRVSTAATKGERELLGPLSEKERRSLHDLASRVLSPHWPPRA